ncbi:MAG: hypothetical protein H7A05_10930 [Pseudomonadales bacterium]|nr:hypothetical protein [Pseudomonadales bacterium]
MFRETTEQTIISVSGKVAAGGSFTAAGSGITAKAVNVAAENPDIASNVIAWADVGVIIGIVGAVGGLLINLFFSIRKDRREAAFHKARMADIGKSR